MPSGMYRPGKRPVCGWPGCGITGSPSLHGHRGKPKRVCLYRLASSILLRKPGALCGALLNAALDTPTRAGGKPAKKRSPYSPGRGGNGLNIIKLEI